MSDRARTQEPLSRFTENPPEFIQRVRASGQPVLLQDETGAEIIVQDAQAYQRLVERVELLESMAAIREGMEDVQAGRTRPMRKALEELRQKHGLSR